LSLTAADLKVRSLRGGAAAAAGRVAPVALVFFAHGGGPSARSLRGRAAGAAGRGRSRCTKTKQQKNTLVPALSRPLGGAEAKGADAPAR